MGSFIYDRMRDKSVTERAGILYQALQELGGWQEIRDIQDHIYEGPWTGTYIEGHLAYTSMLKLLEDGLIKSRHINSRVRQWKII